MTLVQAIVAIIVAAASGAFTSYLQHKQFLLKRKDDKEDKNTRKMIADAVAAAKEEMREEFKNGIAQSIESCGEIGDKAIAKMIGEVREEFQEGLRMRGEEGKERFDINSKQITENTAIIKEILAIQKDQTEKMGKMTEAVTALAQVSENCAESQRNSNYDRLLIVTNKILKTQKMTITEKTNLIQLYDSWQKLQGKDPRIDTLYNECIKIRPTLDEEN